MTDSVNFWESAPLAGDEPAAGGGDWWKDAPEEAVAKPAAAAAPAAPEPRSKLLPGGESLLGKAPTPAAKVAPVDGVTAEELAIASKPAFGGARIKRTTTQRTLDDPVSNVTELFKGGMYNIAGAARDFAQKTGIASDPAEEAYIQQNARRPEDVEPVRAEYQALKKSTGVMAPLAGAPVGRIQTGEINRPAGPSIAEMEDRAYRARVERDMRDATPEMRAGTAAAPIPFRVGPPARAAQERIDRENMDPGTAMTREGRIVRRASDMGDGAQASVDMDIALGVPDRGALARADVSTLDLARAREWQDRSGGARTIERFGSSIGYLDAARVLLIGEITGDQELVSGARARLRQRSDQQTEMNTGGKVGPVQQWFEQLGVSVAQNLGPMLLAPVTGGASLALGSMAAMSMLQSFGEATQRFPNSPFNERLTKSSIDGVMEAIGERVGMPSFMTFAKAIGGPSMSIMDYAKLAARHMLKEQAGEQVTYAGQYVNDLLSPVGGLNEASAVKFLLGAAEVAAATFFQVGALAGAGRVAQGGLEKLLGPSKKPSDQFAAALQGDIGSRDFAPEGIDAAARSALDPANAQMARTGPPPGPVIPPAGVQLAELKAAMKDPRSIQQQAKDAADQERARAAQVQQQEQEQAAAAQAEAQAKAAAASQSLTQQYGLPEVGARVTAEIPGTPGVTGTVEEVNPSEEGGYELRLRTDDGELYVVTGEDNTPFRPEAQGDGTSTNPIKTDDARDLDAAVAENTDSDPTPGQKEAGNYPMTHLAWNALDISIETAKGGTRTAADGSWSVPDFPAHYGRFKGTIAMDGDHLDSYIGPNLQSDKVFVIDQIDHQTGEPDEHKVMIGFDSIEAMRDVWERAFNDGKGLERAGAVTEMTVQGFKDWAANPKNLLKPLAYVKPKAQKKPEYDTTTPTPAVAKGMVRMYHGGNPEDVDGALWFTRELPDAKGWAARADGMRLWYVDVSESDRRLGGEPEFGVLAPSRMELPAEIANQRRPFIETKADDTPLTEEELSKLFDEAVAGADGPAPQAQTRLTINDVPPAILKKIKVQIDRMVGDAVQRVDVAATEALTEIDDEISAYQKLLDCVRSAA